jgi:glycosyltransferase involved in cell wall biosynthesis
MRAPFLRTTVDGLAGAGLASDVLYIRGYRGLHCYAAGTLGCLLLPLLKRYRLVHAHAGEAVLAARFYLKAPVLASYWGSDLLAPAMGKRRFRGRRFLLSRLLLPHSLTMTATTTKSEEMHRRLPMRTRRRDHIIPDGVDRTRFKPMSRPEARQALGWPADGVTAITVGRRDPAKRVELAAAAVEVARHAVPDLTWKLISDAPAENMPLYYNAADLLLHTSVSEGSPNVVKEALACNLPVVATDAGDIAWLIEGVRPAAIAAASPGALAEAIVACLSFREPGNGRERTAHLAVEHTTARTLQVYASLGLTPEGSVGGLGVCTPGVGDLLDQRPDRL